MIGCPNCGTPRESLSMSQCPECGHQIGPASEVKPAFADYGFEMSPDWSNAGGSGSETISRPASPANPQRENNPANPSSETSESPQTHKPASQRNTSDELHAFDMPALLPETNTLAMADRAMGLTPQETAQTHKPASQIETGNVPAMPQPESPASEPPATRVVRRFMSEGRWINQLSKERDQMYRLAKKRFPSKESCLDWVYGELDRMYPPLNKPVTNSTIVEKQNLRPSPDVVSGVPPDDGAIQGLGTIPEGWPELPANASMSAEIGWVQANRLRIVKEQPGKATVVDLGLALSPAPSWAALGWLETSIRSYAKFVDVAAKASGSDDGEAAVMRRERMSIEEVRSLLAEMEEQVEGRGPRE